jgi:hypothetical protein
MAILSENELAVWEKNRDLNSELLQGLQEIKHGEWARKTEFILQGDGSILRVILRRHGTFEKDQIIPAEKARLRLQERQPAYLKLHLPSFSVFQYALFKRMGAGPQDAVRSGCYIAESGFAASRSFARVGSITCKSPMTTKNEAFCRYGCMACAGQ